MKYSLRSLFIAVTLVCIVLGVRIEYLRRMEVYHRREFQDLLTSIRELSEEDPGRKNMFGRKSDVDQEEYDRSLAKLGYHQRMQERYMAATHRPWTLVPDDRPSWMSP